MFVVVNQYAVLGTGYILIKNKDRIVCKIPCSSVRPNCDLALYETTACCGKSESIIQVPSSLVKWIKTVRFDHFAREPASAEKNVAFVLSGRSVLSTYLL